ncbi:hypothetical protein C1645_761571 [Glomus cerebriforme]|uniref:Uncharacterized protein n=1 Tax=Glomus cerebriforme TaxID=658196 RepID=A0A397T6C3_9GLOM|nr:hypothetical protein C1645_761571 [Glomus cerebriforme]
MPQNDLVSSTGEISDKKYTIPVGIVFFLLGFISFVQGIIAITFGSLFNSFSLSTFGISSIGQIIIIYYIYHQIVTEHYVRKLDDAATETTPILGTGNNINSRRVTEKKIAVTGMFIYALLAGIIAVSLFYINKRLNNNPNNPTEPPGDDSKKRPFVYILVFSIYAIHPFFILTPIAWYFSTSKTTICPAWKNATIWCGLLFLVAYTQFINSQLLYFVAWKTREIVCTLVMVTLFLVYAIRLFALYLWKGGNYENIRH